MARDVDAAMVAETKKRKLGIAAFVELEPSGGPLRFWTGWRPYEWDGKTWLGAGDLLGIGDVEETADLYATGVNYTLSGIPTASLATIYTEDVQGRRIRHWLATTNPQTGQMIATHLCFAGRMDALVEEEGSTEATIGVAAESNLIDMQKPRERRWTDQDHQEMFPGDLFCQHVAAIQDLPVDWGAKPRK